MKTKRNKANQKDVNHTDLIKTEGECRCMRKASYSCFL